MYSASFLCTGAGSTTLPCGAIYGSANGSGVLRKITVYNPTATAVDIAIRRLTTAGTVGAGVDEINWVDAPPPELTVFQAHTGAPTITAGFIDRYQFPAAMAGAAMIWTYEGSGLQIPKGVANGIGVIPAVGTGQLVGVTFQWEES